MLFLPAYRWHEVITEPLPATDEMTVSLNFWFTATRLLLSPALPLRPPLRVELARQLEYLISDALAGVMMMMMMMMMMMSTSSPTPLQA